MRKILNIELLFVIAFFYTNIVETGATGNNTFLALSLAIGVYNIIASSGSICIKMKAHHILIFMFFWYYFVRIAIDSGSVSDIKAQFFETTSGLIFYMGLGNYVMMLQPYDLTKLEHGKYTRLILLYSFALSAHLLFVHTSSLREDVFLLRDDLGAYQRPANLMIMWSVILAITYLRGLSGLSRDRKYHQINGIVLILNYILLMLISQIIGSNLGLVVILSIAVLTRYVEYFYSKGYNTGSPKSFIGSTIRKACLDITFLVTFATILYHLSPELISKITEKFRIFGFGSGEVSSIESRYTILTENFLLHWMANPLLGNSIIEIMTTGEGTYVHSLLSLLSHTGILGTSLFCIGIIAYGINQKQQVNSGGQRLDVGGDAETVFLNSLICTILLWGMVATAFTWSVLWFVIGMTFQFIMKRQRRRYVYGKS